MVTAGVCDVRRAVCGVRRGAWCKEECVVLLGMCGVSRGLWC